MLVFLMMALMPSTLMASMTCWFWPLLCFTWPVTMCKLYGCNLCGAMGGDTPRLAPAAFFFVCHGDPLGTQCQALRLRLSSGNKWDVSVLTFQSPLITNVA